MLKQKSMYISVFVYLIFRRKIFKKALKINKAVKKNTPTKAGVFRQLL